MSIGFFMFNAEQKRKKLLKMNCRIKAGAAVVSAILLFFTGCSFAQQGNPPGKEGAVPRGMGKNFIQKFDKDNDGKVSKEEFPGPAEHFPRMDKNGDGFITGDEVQPGRPPQMGQMDGTGPQGMMGKNFIQRFDKDNDGKVSKDEFTGRPDRFTGLDKNGDGFISADEMPQGPPPQMGSQGGTPGQMDGTGPHGTGKNFIQRLDKDNDGKVSKEEFTGPPEHFTGLDKNGDGFVSADESPQGLPPQTKGQQN